MKVQVGYEDGRYWLEECSEERIKAGAPYVEINEPDWHEYCAFRETSREWHSWLRQLDNQQYEKEEARMKADEK